MKDEIIEAYLLAKESGAKEFWPKLMKQFGYEKKEKIRSVVRRGLKERGLEVENSTVERVESSSPKIGIADIETLPLLVKVFSLWDQNIGINQIVQDFCLLGWAGKYLNESEVYSDILKPEEAVDRRDERIVRSVWEFLNNCDVLIGHNWSSFDGKVLNTLFLMYNLPPLSYKIVDTLVIAKNNFRFSSRKLEFINRTLGIRQKLETEGFKLWDECGKGNGEYLDKMKQYNIGDTLATEELAYKFRPFIKTFNFALYNEIEELQCPCCGSTELSSNGYYYTNQGKYESLRCNKCKSLSRKKTNLLSKEKRGNLLVSI
jgi:hypothetical protein